MDSHDDDRLLTIGFRRADSRAWAKAWVAALLTALLWESESVAASSLPLPFLWQWGWLLACRSLWG